MRVFELTQAPIWDRQGAKSVKEQMQSLVARDSAGRVLVLDLASLNSPEARLSAVGEALQSLQRAAADRWGEALKAGAEEDTRSPIFIAIDEAHNLAPADPSDPESKAVLDQLVTIAAEGRKYGLFLILVTQRPSRLHPSILSQCDNLLLMKMTNRTDLKLVEDSFGFVPEGWPDRALKFEQGECLLAGGFVERPVVANVAPRRTVEGGRNITDNWEQDPAPPPSSKPAG